jgi:hypothetical protein
MTAVEVTINGSVLMRIPKTISLANAVLKWKTAIIGRSLTGTITRTIPLTGTMGLFHGANSASAWLFLTALLRKMN